MARSTEDIFNGMVAKKESLASLNVYLPNGVDSSYQHVLQLLNTNSKVALWLLVFYIIAEAQHTLENLFDYFKIDVANIIAKHKPGTKEWYRQIAFEWQYGHQLTLVDGVYKYLIDDPQARLVKQCAVNDNGGTVRIKVAGDDGIGNLVALTPMQVASLNAYFIKRRYAGTKTICVSFDADTIRTQLIIRFDALLELASLQAQVKNAIKTYLKSLPFDGTVVFSELVNAIQAVTGVTDVVTIKTYGTYGFLPNQDRTLDGYYATNAGYANNDEIYFDANTTWEAVV